MAERKKGKKKKLCAYFSADILMVFNIFTPRDKESVHPKFFLPLLQSKNGPFQEERKLLDIE